MKNVPTTDTLAQLRTKIDDVDHQLVALVLQRAQLASQVGEYKTSNAGGTQPDTYYRPEREAQIIAKLLAKNDGLIADADLRQIFVEIISSCRAVEQRLRVAYLGPKGTFSEQAVTKHFGHAVTAVAEKTIDAVFHSVESSQCQFGLVPIENSTEGAIGRSLDLLVRTPLTVCGEISLRIRQHLLSQADSFERIDTVYSHPQSLAQCQEWLAKHLPNATLCPVASNAQAAQFASEAGAASGAIAGVNAATEFALPILAENIEDQADNTTRWLVLAAAGFEVAPSGEDKTSIVVATRNESGALYALLKPLKDLGLSMTRLESRPSQIGLWEYVFFIDFLGHRQQPEAVAALAQINKSSSFLKVLGAYPKAKAID